MALEGLDLRSLGQAFLLPPSLRSCSFPSRPRSEARRSSAALESRCLSLPAALAVGAVFASATRFRHIRRRGVPTMEVETHLTLLEVEEAWEEVESLKKGPEDLARICALLCCVQRQLGYWAALHEGTIGAGSVVSKAPPLPMVVSWEGPDAEDGKEKDVYGACLAATTGETLLQQLLNCVRQAQNDKRWATITEEVVTDLKAKVSLLRGFVDISDTPGDWIPGTHGLWYSDGSRAVLVYLPEVAELITLDASSDSIVERMRGIVQRRAMQADAEAGEIDDSNLSLPEGHSLYRFETCSSVCRVDALPSLKTRRVSEEHLRDLIFAQAQLSPGRDEGLRIQGSEPAFAVMSQVEEQAARALIVPNTGIYGDTQQDFNQALLSEPLQGLEQVRRVIILAPVWDCYIDGCGLPEQRCAWYGNVPLDIPVLEALRSSKVFQELTVEQDERERAIEALLPLACTCLPQEQNFTLVPVLVGGMMTERAEKYVQLLAPYLTDPENLFIVAGEVGTLSGGIDWERCSDIEGGPERFMLDASCAVNRFDKVVPAYSALELFLGVVAQSSMKGKLSVSRYW